MKDSTIKYFAYGANLNPRVFIKRRKMKIIASEPAILKGFRLTFNQPGLPYLEPGFANIEPSKKDIVYGVVYTLSKKEYERLYKLEGGGAYEDLITKVISEKSGKIESHIFWVKRGGYNLKPSKRYMDILIEGANIQKLPVKYIKQLKNQPTYKSFLSPFAPIIMFVLSLLFKLGMSTPFNGWREKQIEKAKIHEKKSKE